MLLALETSTNVCSVAFKDEQGEVYEKRIEKRGTHSEKLFLFIEELMAEHGFVISELEAVLVSEGPGSYTGLRISASAVKGLLFQTDVPLWAFNTLAVFAESALQQAENPKTIHAVIDARRVHLYHQEFAVEGNNFLARSDVEIVPIKQVQEMIKPTDVVIGTGLNRINNEILADVIQMGVEQITAKSLFSLYEKKNIMHGKQKDPEAFDPKYSTSRQVEK